MDCYTMDVFSFLITDHILNTPVLLFIYMYLYTLYLEVGRGTVEKLSVHFFIDCRNCWLLNLWKIKNGQWSETLFWKYYNINSIGLVLIKHATVYSIYDHSYTLYAAIFLDSNAYVMITYSAAPCGTVYFVIIFVKWVKIIPKHNSSLHASYRP